jgi:transmembrane sensor
MNYCQFNAEDLAADDYFKEWVCSPTPETDTFWRAFISDYPERYYQVEEARQLVAGLEQIEQRPTETVRVDALWNRIEDSLDTYRIIPAERWLTRSIVWKIAASLLLFLGVSWVGQTAFKQTELSLQPFIQPANDWVETLNEASQVMHIQLVDGSRVTLHKGGHLRYKSQFSGTKREVYLTGDAFFEVTKNPNKPFVVYANGLVTKVLGTSFRINAPTGAPTVTVDVKSGRVSVYPNQSGQAQDPESKGLVLTPNQQAVFHRDEAKLDKSLVENPDVLLSEKEAERFVFDDASAASVFRAIEKTYGVTIIFDEEVMQDCTITMSLDRESLFQKLDVICRVLDAEYKLIDAQIVIYSKGCSGSRNKPIHPSQ